MNGEINSSGRNIQGRGNTGESYQGQNMGAYSADNRGVGSNGRPAQGGQWANNHRGNQGYRQGTQGGGYSIPQGAENYSAAQVQGRSKVQKGVVKNKKDNKNRMTGGKITAMILGILMMGSVTYFGAQSFYKNTIKYPPEESYVVEDTGRYAIDTWQSAVNTYDTVIMENLIEETGYLAQEETYTNNNENRLNFIKAVTATVKYEYPIIQANNIFGYPMVDTSDEPVMIESRMNGEEDIATVSYIDFSQIELDEEKIKSMMLERGLEFGQVDFSNKITDLFCDYICSLEELPVKTEERHIPLVGAQDLVGEDEIRNFYKISPDEDEYLDQVLFSNEDMYKLTDEFSVICIGERVSDEWLAWDALTDAEKNGTPEPEMWNAEWLEWDKLSEEEKEARLEEDEDAEPIQGNELYQEWVRLDRDEKIDMINEGRIPLIVQEEVEGSEELQTREVPMEEWEDLSKKQKRNMLENVVVAREMPEWIAWNNLSDAEKNGTPEPEKIQTNLVETQEWVDWNKLSDDEKELTAEPERYYKKDWISDRWCGSYHLQHYKVVEDGKEVEASITPDVGDGSIESPAGIGTPILSVVQVTNPETGEIEDKPIRITLKELLFGQDAINYFESKDVRNRGLQTASQKSIIAFTIEIQNLSTETLTIEDNSSLTDSQANLTSRTGQMYGLVDVVTLAPDETGIIETWASTTDIEDKYLIWGKTFKRTYPVSWFRVLSAEDGVVHITTEDLDSSEMNTNTDEAITEDDLEEKEEGNGTEEDGIDESEEQE